MTEPRYTPLVRSLPATVPFVGPETQARRRGAPFTARLGANESVFGPSPKAIAAMQAAAAETWMYGDAENYDLRGALAALHGVGPQNIMVGEGIDGLLGYLGDAVVTSDGAYPTFNYHVAGYGGVLHKVPYRDDAEDPEALFARAAEVDAKIVYLANPWAPQDWLASLMKILGGLMMLEALVTLAVGDLYLSFWLKHVGEALRAWAVVILLVGVALTIAGIHRLT